jgi:hypothetical protein
MLPYLAHILGLPPAVAYAVVLGALLLATVFCGFVLHRLFHAWARRLQGNYPGTETRTTEALDPEPTSRSDAERRRLPRILASPPPWKA